MTFTLESFVLLADQFASPRGFAARRENHRLHMIGDTSSLRVVSASPCLLIIGAGLFPSRCGMFFSGLALTREFNLEA
jgi:hypothetical protein